MFAVAGLELGLLSLIFYWGYGNKNYRMSCVSWSGEKSYDIKAVADGVTFFLMPLQNNSLEIKPTLIWLHISQMNGLSQISQLFLQTSESLTLKLFKQGMLSI